MILRSLELKNIRSYEHQTVTFSHNTTLLSGDIGSGKTTILIAIEFALFGILRGKTSPAELLRHGENQGSVTLTFESDGDIVTVTRGLKRSSSSITQTSGSLTINDLEETLVPTELKAKLLSILGYPDSLLSRSTNLFRYTVYTPQEQVKAILYESVEQRKDIIRKIFDIDKYRRISENASFYQSDLRERIARLQGQTDDIATLKNQYEQQQKQHAQLTSIIPDKQKRVDTISKQRGDVEKDLEQKRQTKIQYDKQLSVINQLKQSIDHHKKTLAMLSKQRDQLKETISSTTFKESSFDPEKKKKVQDALDKLLERKRQFDNNYGECKATISQANSIISRIHELTVCPTCKQDVSPSHKERIRSDQQSTIAKASSRKEQIDELYRQLNEKQERLTKKQQELLEQEKLFVANKEQSRRLKQDKDNLERIHQQLASEQEQLNNASQELESQTNHLQTIKTVDIQPLQNELNSLREHERKAELELQDARSQLQTSSSMLKTLSKAIEEKQIIARKISTLSSLNNWVKELFSPLVKTIEKRVLLSVYHEFNQHFTNWFSQLIDDSIIQVRLDEEFTPIIVQNGFDTSLENLSGGERTSVALSYRLALNKVLNDHFSALNTKDLLILDEPTDGFSTQQLDTLREVLMEAGVKQLIIVSHEQKLESLADHLIRISKQHNTSTILQ